MLTFGVFVTAVVLVALHAEECPHHWLDIQQTDTLLVCLLLAVATSSADVLEFGALAALPKRLGKNLVQWFLVVYDLDLCFYNGGIKH